MSRLKALWFGMSCAMVLLFAPDRLLGSTESNEDPPSTSPVNEVDAEEKAMAPDSAPSSNKPELTVPWKKGAEPSVGRTPFQSAYQALKHNMSESELQYMFEQSSFDPHDPALVKIMYRFPLIGLDHIERFAKENRTVAISDVAAAPESFFGKVFRFSGRAKRVRQADLLARVAEGFDFDHFYLVEMEVDKSLPTVLVCARTVPKSWPRDEPIDELASCYGMLIQANDLDDSTRQLVFASDRVAWHPDRANKEAGIGTAQLLLSKLGMDFGLFDTVRPFNGRQTIEPECFYQLLSALAHTSSEELSKHSAKFDLAQLLGDPKSQHGNLIMVEGSARRIQKIDISGTFMGERFGIDHYYEVSVFIPLERPVKLSQGAGEPIEYKKNFPVIIDVLRLPEGLSESESLSERVRIPCVYFKLWAYRSQYVTQHNEQRLQLSPLLLGIEPEVVETDTSINPYVAAAALGLFVLALGGLWIGLWRTSRKDDEFERTQVERQFEVEKGKSLNTMGIDVDQDPDFSKLD